MKKLFTSLMLMGMLVMPGTLNSQIFWEEDFSDGIPADWTNTDLSQQDIIWSDCNTDCDLPGIYVNRFNATTAENGFAFLNALQYGNLPENFFTELTTPLIDCSNINEAFIQFQTAISTFNLNPANHVKLFVLGDDIEEVFEFTPFPALRRNDIGQYAPVESIDPDSPLYVTFDISHIVSISETIRIRWQWEGDYENFWAIDDVQLSTNHPAQPAQTLWFSDFAFGTQGWTSNVISGPDSLWQWVAGGNVSNAFSVSGIPSSPQLFGFIHSQTHSNGAMVFNADYYNTQGDIPPQIPKQFVCELVSPTINLPDESGPFEVQFTQLLRLGNLANNAPSTPEGAKFIASYSYSLDGGESWSSPYNTAPYVTPSTVVDRYRFENNRFYISIPKEAAGSNEFRMKFTWAADYYFWVIDDVAIVQRPEYDIKVNRNFIAMMPNLVTPESQLTETPLMADIENTGSQPASGVVEKVHIRKDTEEELVFQDSLVFENMPVDSLIENVLFETLTTPSYFEQTGRYNAYYAVTHDVEDNRPENDTLDWWFEVSDSTFAKENGFTRDIFPQLKFNYTYGNIFYVPNGEGWFARHITFGISRAETLQAAGRNVEVRLFKWEGDLNDDHIANENELEELSVYYHLFENTQSTAIITVPVSEDGQGVPLEDNTFYIAAIRYVYTSGPPMRMLANDTIDYQATVFAGQQAGLPTFASALDIGNTGDFNTLGFGYSIIPMVRLHISQSPNAIRQQPKAKWSLIAYPNPCHQCDQITLELTQPIRDGKFSIIDMSGRRIFEKNLTHFTKNHFTFDARYLSGGNYILKIENENIIATTKLVVVE